jgi:hypothetical protein
MKLRPVVEREENNCCDEPYTTARRGQRSLVRTIRLEKLFRVLREPVYLTDLEISLQSQLYLDLWDALFIAK